MYLSAQMLAKNHLALPVNGLLSEFEMEDGGVLLRLQTLRQYDGIGQLRVDAELNPLESRKLFLRKEIPTYRLREGYLYEATFAIRFTEPLPPGIVGFISQSNRVVDAGLVITSRTYNGVANDQLLTATLYSQRRVELDAMFPVAVLRFAKMDVTLRSREEEQSETEAEPEQPDEVEGEDVVNLDLEGLEDDTEEDTSEPAPKKTRSRSKRK